MKHFYLRNRDGDVIASLDIYQNSGRPDVFHMTKHASDLDPSKSIQIARSSLAQFCQELSEYLASASTDDRDIIGGGFLLEGKPVPIRKIDDVDGPLIGFTCRDEDTGEMFEDTVGYDCAHIRDMEFVRYLDGEITEW